MNAQWRGDHLTFDGVAFFDSFAVGSGAAPSTPSTPSASSGGGDFYTDKGYEPPIAVPGAERVTHMLGTLPYVLFRNMSELPISLQLVLHCSAAHQT